MSNEEHRPKAEDIPGQKLPYPARQSDMTPAPDSDLSNNQAADKLRGKVALITGGDSGIGRAVALAFAMEGANVAIVYNENDGDASTTRELVEARDQRRHGFTQFALRDFPAVANPRGSCSQTPNPSVRRT